MTLAAAKPTLQDEINAAYTRAKDDGSEDDAVSDDVIANLATDLANAIDKYTREAKVTTTGETDAGQPVPPGAEMDQIGTTGEGTLE